MKIVLRRHLTIILILITMVIGVRGIASAKGWEPIKTERPDAKTILRETEIEIKAASGVLIITSNKPVHVKVFTILGRLVSSETLNPGRNQLQLPTHGVYIVKVGDLTCKVAV